MFLAASAQSPAATAVPSAGRPPASGALCCSLCSTEPSLMRPGLPGVLAFWRVHVLRCLLSALVQRLCVGFRLRCECL